MTHIPVADPHALLALWERALPLPPAAREALLAGEPAAHTVGEQRRRLLRALRQLGPERLALRCACPACSEQASVDVDPLALLQALPPTGEQPDHRLDDGPWRLRFRLPAPGDLQALADIDDVEAFVHALLRRCVLDARQQGRSATPDTLPQALCERLSARMEALDPAASLAFAVRCPTCGHAWAAAFDPGQALWTLLQSHAEQLLLDVDTLAQRYGWHEREILALTSMRRQAYLQLARAD
ncbi:MAG: hypothetical protein OEU93_19175 [Rubrivivax sp.]|nr:hypothetical protein [Rubrivivax sp.]MDH5339950.1 hypothetical protein [Rubrivivax sp.]